MRCAVTTIIAISILGTTFGADKPELNWPQLRGNESHGFSSTAKPPLKWSETENLKWKAPLPGPGSSSPIIVGQKVFVTCYSGYGLSLREPGSMKDLKRHLICFDRTTGKQLWRADVPAVLPEDTYRTDLAEHGYASSTPVSDGEAVYVFFGKSGVLAYNLDGKQLWKTSVGVESDIRGWGSAASPVLYKDLVIVNAASEGRAIIALKKSDGTQAWKAAGNRLSLSFSTPALVSSPERTELVVAMPTEVWGINPDTGKLAWYASISPNGNVCPGVIPGNGIAYISGGYMTRGSLAIKVGGKDDVTKSNVIWTNRSSPYIPTPVLHEKRLYCITEDGMALCQNAETGKLIYEERLPLKSASGARSRPYYASTILADGKLYVPSRKGGVFVLKAGDSFEVLQQNPALDASDFNATPAVVGKELYLRSNQYLYCLEEK